MPDQSQYAQGERELLSKVFRDFKGVYTKSDRTAMPENAFYDLENLQPIGAANLHTVPNISASLHDFSTDVIYYSQYAQVGTVPYQISFSTNGKVFAYNWNTTTTTTISTALSGAGTRMTQWMNTYILIIDANGYYSWDGTTFTLRNGAQQPTAGSDIAVCFGRVWVSSGRLLTYTGAYDGTSTLDPTANTAWLTANGAGFTNFTDPTLSGLITRLWAQNSYLYVFGATCLYAISDLYVPSGASPPTPVYTITNVQAIVGTDQPLSVFPYNRALMFANRYGAWAVSGVNAERISEDIDGTWQYLSFSPQISGGQCVVNNILNAAFLLQRSNDPVFGSNTVIGLWFDEKWWFGVFGTITFLCTALIGNVPTLIAFIGNKMYSIFTNAASSPNTRAMTPLWSMDDPFSFKQVVRGGIELIISQFGGTVSTYIDTPQDSKLYPSSGAAGSITFVNNTGGTVTFTGTGGAALIFIVGAYLFQSGSTPGGYSNYVGQTVTTTGLGFQIASFMMDYKKGKRW